VGLAWCQAERFTRLRAAQEDKPSVEKRQDDKKPEFKEAKSGLKYRVLREGAGPKPTAADRIKVHYRGWLDNGKEFDNSYKSNKPFEVRLNRMIAGWTEGMQLVGVGGEIELEVPYVLGYGERGFPPDIPPKATLHFTVELLDIVH
jgi:FKBP-type peptidyl-prolyl cis-trans isomerase FkpA